MGAECSRCRLPPGREAKESAVDAQKQVGPDRGRQHGRGHQANSPGASLPKRKGGFDKLGSLCQDRRPRQKERTRINHANRLRR
jgi:hypothetical protein